MNQDDGELFGTTLEKETSPFEEDTPWFLWEQQKEQARKSGKKRNEMASSYNKVSFVV